MPNVSDVSIKMQDLRSAPLQIAAKCGKVRANTRHAGCGDCARRLEASTTRLATSLLGESWWTAFTFFTFFTFVPRPAILALAPLPFVGLFVPVAPIVLLPPRWRITTPFLPPGRRYSVVADGDLKDRGWDARWFDDRPRSVPALPEIPPATLERPILMAIEEDVLGRAGRIVDRHSWDDHERRGSW
jgi:hypothetical protein